MTIPSIAGLELCEGPTRAGSELRYRGRLGSGTPVCLAVLAAELARDEALRRRYVGDIERVAALKVDGIAATLEIGPQPDPRDPDAAPPWRLRYDPPGRSLRQWMMERGAAPLDEAVRLIAGLADVVAGLHRTGSVLRGLRPENVIIGDDDRVWLADFGLTRVDILSSRTAASLIVETSAYVAPEQWERTQIDQRADVYALGVILFEALTATLPFELGPSFLHDHREPIRPSSIRGSVPQQIDDLIALALARDPAQRLPSAKAFAAALRGESIRSAEARTACQACGTALVVGQRLCPACGSLAVRFTHTAVDPEDRAMLVLTKARETTEFSTRLHEFLTAIGREVDELDFLIGSPQLYSQAERSRLRQLPCPVVSHIDVSTAESLQSELAKRGIETDVWSKARQRGRLRRVERGIAIGGAAVTFAAIVATAVLWTAQPIGFVILAGLGALFTMITMAIVRTSFSVRENQLATAAPLIALRPQSAALPASDPLVAKLAAALGRTATADDVRKLVGELALWVQRLVDRKLEFSGQAAEISMLTEPVEPLIDFLVQQIDGLQTIDRELTSLDEGKLTRNLAAARARSDRVESDRTLNDLDRLRELEEQRARAFHRLLDTGELLRRNIELGLSVVDETEEHERHVKVALARLGGGEA